ncbi:general odorant-binding protein 45-like [Anopheles aquasalis]|uniref:general odorant-binding protein 45-like n=1 Tax=Anopheles aquasalis TaxID=42839 RepID=UPI00215B003A|nr:general odorant-binding protein 45-like [Anopheles aquasalis]
MQRAVLLLLLLLVAVSCCWTVQPVAGALGGCSYGYTSKSIAQAYLECLQYLNVSRQPLATYDETDTGAAGNCLVRCIGLTTRWWDDERGILEPALLRHFRNTEVGLLEQARQCVGSLTGTDRCQGAYRSFRCYADLLGELVAHPRFLPPRTGELLGAVSECAELLQLSGQRVARYVTSTFLRDGPGTRLLRCIVLQLGLYSDSKGVLSERLALLPGVTNEPDTGSPLKAKQCEASVRDLGVDVCRLAAHSIEQCYGREAFGELWPLMMHRYAPDGVAQQYVQGPTLPDNTTPQAAAPVRSKLVFLRKHDERGTAGGAVPFEMVIADSDYRDIARLLESEPSVEGEPGTPATAELELAETGELPDETHGKNVLL